MKQKFFISFTLFSAILIGSSFAVSNGAHEAKAAAYIKNYKYSTGDLTNKVGASKLLEEILRSQGDESQISQAESEYLDANYSFEYDALDNPTYNVGKVDGYYWVEAFDNGQYTPKYLSVIEDNVEKQYDFVNVNKQLVARVPEAYIMDAKIVYETKLNIHKEDVNELLPLAYSLGKSESETIVAKQQYDNYHDVLLPQYNQYLIDKATYDLEKANFDQYQVDLLKFESDSAKYTKYLEDKDLYVEQLAAYSEYLNKLDIYNKNKQAYEDALKYYNEEMEKITYHLALLDVLFEKMGSLQISIADYIETGSVDTVLRRKDEIILAGVEETPVLSAGKQTEIIRKLLKSYKEVKDGSVQDKLTWYNSHYFSMRNAFVELTKCLDYFFKVTIVQTAIENEGRTKKYTEFVAELIYFSDLIYGSPIPDYYGGEKLNASHIIGDNKGTYTSILGIPAPSLSITPFPGIGTLPVMPGDPGEELPDPVEKPIAPVEVKKPIAPTPVVEPTPIEVVNKPTKVEMPANPINPELADLAAAYNAGLLFNRDLVNEDIELSLKEEVVIDTSNVKKLVALCDTTRGITSGSARVREFIYYDDASSAVIKTRVTDKYGVFASNNEDIAVIFAEYASPDAFTDSLSSILDNQKIAVDSYEVTWKHVLNNASHKDYVSLDYESKNTGQQFFVPEYDLSGSLPAHDDVYENGVRKYAYVFVGYDYTDDDEIISGLTTTDEIVEKQGLGNKAVINVVFDKVETFDVSFEGLNKVSYLKGTSIDKPSYEPKKPEYEGVRYKFVGWTLSGSSEIVSFPYVVNETTSFVPKFEAINTYKVTFVNEGKNVSIQYIDNGGLPVAPTDLVKERTDDLFFTFKGWDKEIAPVSENITYTAVYESHKIVPNASVSIAKVNVEIVSNDNSIVLSDYFDLYRENSFGKKGTFLSVGENQILLSATQTSYLANVGVDEISLETGENNSSVTLVAKKNGVSVDLPSLSLAVTLNMSDAEHVKAFNADGEEISSSTVSKNSLRVLLKTNSRIDFVYYYKVNFDKYMNSVNFKINGEDVVLGESYEFVAGTQVTVSVEPKVGVELVTKGGTTTGLFINDEDGYRVDLTSGNLTVGDRDITIYANIIRKMHVVNLYVDNLIYQTFNVAYGSSLHLPSDISKAPDSNYRYVFIGWDKEISVVDGDYDVEALFEKIPLEEEKEDDGATNDGLTLGQKVGIGAIALVAAAITITSIVVMKKNHKKPQKD